MKYETLNEWQLSPRVWLRPGLRVRFAGGGPVYGPRSDRSRITLPGTFRILAIVRRGRRVWLEVFGDNRTGGTFTVLVAGPAYTRHGVRWRPYNVKRAH